MVGVDQPKKALSIHFQKPYNEKLSKFSYLSFYKKKSTRLLHAYVQCVYIVHAKYQIAPSKAVVGVDLPMKALSMHIQKPYKGKLSKFS